jgi:hypothetical protein
MLNRVRKLGERQAVAPIAPKTPRAPRQPVFRQATLAFDSGERMTVALKDVSETGARIEFMMITSLPPELLFIEPTLKIRRRARVMWQRDGVAGLLFL